ncbi:MAG: hypothetical protein ACTH0S_08670 [Senegalia sp. (in: firmicutes)]
MDQVSPEVKEAYLNNLTYTTINKKDWKALNDTCSVDSVSNKQNKFIYSMLVLSFVIAFIVSITSIIFDNVYMMIFAVFSAIPPIIIVIEDKYCIFYNKLAKKKRFLYNYRKANDTFSVLIEGNDKHRYYSRWYLELDNPKVKADSKIYENKYVRFNEVKTEQTDIYYSDICDLFLLPVTRHSDRFNWRNTLSTNRVLSVEEYKNLNKSKEEFKKYMKMEEDIKEFQKYNGL